MRKCVGRKGAVAGLFGSGLGLALSPMLVALSLAALTIAGVAGTVAAAATAAGSATGSGPAAGQIVIRMYSGMDSSHTVFEQYLRMYEKLHPNVKIENLGYEWDVNKLTTLFVAGNAPDIIQHGTGYIMDLYREGFIAPVPADFAARLKEAWYPVFGLGLTYEGRLIGVPAENTVSGLWYNNEVLAEAGIASPPRNFDELEKVGAKLARFAADGRLQRAALVEQGEWWSFNHFGWVVFKALGGRVFDPQGKLVLDSKPLRDLLAIVPRWIGPKGFMGQGWNDQLVRFFKGEIAMGFGYLWWARQIQNHYKGDYLKAFGVGLFPQGPGGEYGALHYAHAYAVNKFSKHQDEAWKLLEWLLLQPVEGITPLGHALCPNSLPVIQADFRSPVYDVYRPWMAGFISNLQYAWTGSQFRVYGIDADNVDFATAIWQVRDGTASPAQAIEGLVQKVQNKINEFQASK
ncbi:MAG: extracellular solute-binding protein [Limnochordales bacterium]|nr:extracellular solute-binding protein [Limnochordales bacterium]